MNQAVRASILFVTAALLLNGCTRFHPQPLVPGKTAAQLESRSLTNSELRTFLEQNLHHPITNWPIESWDFDTLTLVAFYYNPSLDVARADWRVAAAGTETAAERPNPTATASGIYEPAAGAFSPWIPGVIFDLPIETAGKRRFRMDQARHLSDSARFSLATSAWQVRSHLRSSLLDFVSAREHLALVRNEFELRQDLTSRLERQLQAGAISAYELNVARLALVKARADLADAQRVLAEAQPALADVLGMPARALDDSKLQFDLTTAVNAEAMTSSEARDLALRGRSDILGALADYAASQSDLQLAVAKQYPDIHLNPGYSWNAGSTGEHDWQVGVTVELPILNRHQGPIGEASARRDASAARFLALQAKVINEIDGAVASFRSSQTNATALEALFQTQTSQHHAIEQQFEAGALDRLDVVNAGLELNAAALARLDSQVRFQRAVGALEDAVQRPFVLPNAIFQASRSNAP
jgi:outer membrane protein TolC